MASCAKCSRRVGNARTASKRLNGNFDLLCHIVGEGWIGSEIERGFPLDG